MVESEKGQFATLLLGMGSYYEKELAAGVIDIYWRGLEQFDLEAVRVAFDRHMANPDSGQWMPRVADLVKMLQGRTGDQAQAAWAKVDRAVRSSPGVNATVAFDDPLIHRVLADIGGWASLGDKQEKEWPFIAKEFENRYRSYRMRGETPEYPPSLIGTIQAQNQAAGKQGANDIYLIGDQRAAIAVIRGGSDNASLKIGMVDARTINHELDTKRLT